MKIIITIKTPNQYKNEIFILIDNFTKTLRKIENLQIDVTIQKVVIKKMAKPDFETQRKIMAQMKRQGYNIAVILEVMRLYCQ